MRELLEFCRKSVDFIRLEMRKTQSILFFLLLALDILLKPGEHFFNINTHGIRVQIIVLTALLPEPYYRILRGLLFDRGSVEDVEAYRTVVAPIALPHHVPRRPIVAIVLADERMAGAALLVLAFWVHVVF